MLSSKTVYCDLSSMMCFNEHENKNVCTPNILHQKREARKKDSGNNGCPDAKKKNGGMVCWSPSAAISSRKNLCVSSVL